MSRRVLIARQDSLGDVLLCGPAIRAVAASGAHVTLLCGPRGLAAAELLPGVDELLEWRADWIDAEPEPVKPRRIERFVELIETLRFDEALIFTSFHQSPLPLALLLRMAGVGRIGAISDDYSGSLLDVRHRVPADIHEVERGLSLALACGYELPSDDDARLRLLDAGEPHPHAVAARPYVIVHPGASVSARAWPAQRHAELIELLLAQGRNVVVTGTRAERALIERVLVQPIGHIGSAEPDAEDESFSKLGANAGLESCAGRLVDLCGRTDLRGLAATIAGAEAIVVGNTGPAHLAAAVGTPVVSLYAPTVPSVRWRPWGVPYRLLERDVPCAGCRARECPIPDHPCMRGIEPAEVLQAVNELAPLGRAGARRRARGGAWPSLSASQAVPAVGA